MEVKVYFNKKFPMSLINTEVDITKDLEYMGSLILPYSSRILDIAFKRCQIEDNNLQLTLPRSLSVGDVLSYKLSGECTHFYLIDSVGFTKL